MIWQILFAGVDRLTEVKIEESNEDHCSIPHQLGRFDDPVYKINRIREEVRNDVEAFETDEKIESFQ